MPDRALPQPVGSGAIVLAPRPRDQRREGVVQLEGDARLAVQKPAPPAAQQALVERLEHRHDGLRARPIAAIGLDRKADVPAPMPRPQARDRNDPRWDKPKRELADRYEPRRGDPGKYPLRPPAEPVRQRSDARPKRPRRRGPTEQLAG